MAARPNRVVVLGAGFTKAFFAAAPLLVDDYDGDALARNFAAFPTASAVLALERQRTGGSRIDLERLMSRLDGGMPHDTDRARDEFRLLLAALRETLVARIIAARGDTTNIEALRQFARHCIESSVTVVTFNYDDALDQALWEVKKVTDMIGQPPYWHPDGGYGFFCRPSVACVIDSQVNMDPRSTLLLKLHGSLNWRVRRGSRAPYVVDAIVHREAWYDAIPHVYKDAINEAAIEAHLEPDPFIVPPVLLKNALIEQPILRVVWQLAAEQLRVADEVVFVGYSMPLTDIAATFLFVETLLDRQDRIRVVNHDGGQARQVMNAYRAVFPRLSDAQFSFDGALHWAAAQPMANEEARG